MEWLLNVSGLMKMSSTTKWFNHTQHVLKQWQNFNQELHQATNLFIFVQTVNSKTDRAQTTRAC